jgi:hypothetical protein
VLWPLCVFMCISTVVMEGTYVSDCRGYRECMVCMVIESIGGECVGGRGNVGTGWGMIGGEGKYSEKSG